MKSGCLTAVLLGVAVSVATLGVEQEPYDYCEPKLKLCEVPTDHTMCKYPVAGLSSKCTPTVHEPLSAIERKKIVYWHNKYRSNVAKGSEKNKNRKPLPTSSNMRQIEWDVELEKIATRWAEQCESTLSSSIYDKCRNTKRFQVSQNVGTRIANGSTIDKQAPQIVISWFKDSKDFDSAWIDKFLPSGNEESSVYQFANMIWAETYAIGCARVIFREIIQGNKKLNVTVERVVCNYGPGGGERGKPVYKRGLSCANCPPGTNCSVAFPGLCSFQNSEKTETQQTLENQESREESRAETESVPQEPETEVEGSVSASEEPEEDMSESPEETAPATLTLSGAGAPTETETATATECEGGICLRGLPASTPKASKAPWHPLNGMTGFPRPTARRNSREIGDWLSEVERLEHPCKCYVPLNSYSEDHDGATNNSLNLLLFLFSLFTLLLSYLK